MRMGCVILLNVKPVEYIRNVEIFTFSILNLGIKNKFYGRGVQYKKIYTIKSVWNYY